MTGFVDRLDVSNIVRSGGSIPRLASGNIWKERTNSTLHYIHPFTRVLPSLRDLMNCNSFLSPASAWSRELCQAVRGSIMERGTDIGLSVLDMTVIAKAISGVEIMRALQHPEVKKETDDCFVAWAK